MDQGKWAVREILVWESTPQQASFCTCATEPGYELSAPLLYISGGHDWFSVGENTKLPTLTCS